MLSGLLKSKAKGATRQIQFTCKALDLGSASPCKDGPHASRNGFSGNELPRVAVRAINHERHDMPYLNGLNVRPAR